MAFNYLNNIELEKALEIYKENLELLDQVIETEEIEVKDSFGRITAEAVYAKISSPHYNACAMDGIALYARSTFGATETTPVILKENTDFVRVDTGDPLPERFDAVVMIEDVIEIGSGAIKLLNAATPWQHVRQIGEDICANEMILPSNTEIRPAAIGALLAGGVLKVRVWKKPIVGLIPTGDEIVSPTGSPKEGEIIEFNSSIFSSMLKEWGAEPESYDIVPDKYERIVQAIRKASEECDVVVINAGSSAGREDFSARAIAEAGKVIIHGIAIRPGKPTILGVVNNKPVIGVPGYPVSGIIVMEKVVKRVLEFLMRIEYPSGVKAKATLSRKIMSSLKYREFVRMKVGDVGGRLIATPLNRGAGVVTSFVKADGILDIPMYTEGLEAGSEVELTLLKNEDEIRNTLVVIGSHDPLIDVVTDIMRRKYRGEYVASAHVGSLGGIMALKRNEAHIAGVHLLDEESGEYNTSYIKRYLGEGNTLKVKGVKRIQGLMVAQGNPKGIKGVEDICSIGRDGEPVRYVNRQKGSGTRILLDYLLRQKGLSTSDIYGYEREEFTHMSVAALVAAGSADVGMGIFSAAKAYGLDFVPVCEEEYDFVLPVQYAGNRVVEHFIEILGSEEFRRELEVLGGYVVEGAAL
ncbi:MAG: molybdopterin biosynthesis protein [Clostridia bacterium]|nr:molybdopterin biosynthesis protein [Clostridia bacterium]